MATGSINISSNISRSEMMAQKYPPKSVTNFSLSPSDNLVKLTWTDPDDYTTTDNKKVVWKYTRIVRKIGSYPINENDGTIVTESSIKNQYQTKAYIDSGLTNYTTYYYRAFSCSTDGVYNHELSQTWVHLVPWKTMVVEIDLNNRDPRYCGEYKIDAVNMESGKTESATSMWQEFFGYRPCLFKDGKVVGYLNPNDFTKFEDGSDADITSGDTGDVMIEFPRHGVLISKNEKMLTVQMTNNPNDPRFRYYAHQRGSTNKDYFYLGVYDGYVKTNKLHSLSGKMPTTNTSLAQFDTYGKANGACYGCMGYYQWLFIQVMYVLQFKGNLNSQNVVGYGNCGGSTIAKTGRSNTKGMIYGGANVAKLFGIEDIWGNVSQYVNNYYGTWTYYITTTTDDTITNVNDYDPMEGYGGSDYTVESYFSDCVGTTESGFTIKYNSRDGSSSTYFCDSGAFNSSGIPVVGGCCTDAQAAGMFHHKIGYDRGHGVEYVGSRLQYL